MDPYASHLPALSRILTALHEHVRSVLEIGGGIYSTPLFRVFTAGVGGEHVVLESRKTWRDELTRLFEIEVVPFTVDALPACVLREWDIAFIDCEKEASRAPHALALKDRAKVIVLHDSNSDWEAAYGYSKITSQWKYQKQFTTCYPHTLAMTNDAECGRALLAAEDTPDGRPDEQDDSGEDSGSQSL